MRTDADYWKRVEHNKNALRKRLASLTYAQKLQLLDRMRERALLFKRARPAKQ